NDATKLLKKRYGEIASRRFVGPQEERVMFEDLVKGIERDYELRGLRSARAAKGRMLHLKKAFAGMRALDITPDRVRDYQAHGRKRHQARSRSLEDEDRKIAAYVAAFEGGVATTRRCETTGLPDGVPSRRRRGHERLVEGVEGSVQARGTAGQEAARLPPHRG